MFDFRIDTTGDITFTPDGDIQTVTGAALVAQDIRLALETPLGSLPWDKSAESKLYLFLNATVDDMAVIAEIRRTVIKDPRIDPKSVEVVKVDGKFRINFATIGTAPKGQLLFDLKELLNG